MRFAGYAAVFDRVDRGGDVVRRGAFGRLAREVPLLWEHQGRAVGRVEYVREDTRGLRVIGRLEDARAAALVADGKVRGLSFGYRVLSTAHLDFARCSARDERVVRELTRLELVEVSLVRFPMQPLARVHKVQGGAQD